MRIFAALAVVGSILLLPSASAVAFGPDIDALRRLHAEPERAVEVGQPETETPPPERQEEPPLRAEVELPKILSDDDASLYRRIFALQEEGRHRVADAVIERLTDKRLVGYVLAHRYLSPGYRTSYRELREWLSEYADNQIAVEVYGLALRRKPRGARRPPRPEGVADEPRIVPRADAPLPRPRWSRGQARAARIWTRRINRNLQRDRLTITERLLARRSIGRLFGPARIDDFRAKLALRWFQIGRTERANKIATAAAERSGKLVPEAHWVAGLTAWAQEQPQVAAVHFQKIVGADRAENSLRAAGAYWAGRAHLALKQNGEAEKWFERGASWPRSFYGVLSRHRAGMEQDYDWQPEKPDPAVLRKLGETEIGKRAFALIQVGRFHEAGQELLRLYYRQGEAHRETYVALADAGNLPQLGYRIGVRAYKRDRSKIDTGLYPLPGWRPDGGFELDRAVVFGIMRQESSFNARARSHAGARGLMQLMPATAAMVARNRALRRREVTRLYNARFNMNLGQRFLSYLIERPGIRGNLFYVFAAYNAGEGNLNRWRKHTDPLLFVESIPLRETREYVKRVTYNLWAYRMRLGQDTPSLEAVSAGRWPHYRALDRN